MKEKLDIIYDFGKDIIVKARDETIKGNFLSVDGKAKNNIGKQLGELIADLPDKQKEKVKYFITWAIDGAINNFLWMMEQNNDKYSFTAKCKDGTQFDIEQESDGLCYGQWEFIDEYSKYCRIEDILETGKIEKEPEQ